MRGASLCFKSKNHTSKGPLWEALQRKTKPQGFQVIQSSHSTSAAAVWITPHTGHGSINLTWYSDKIRTAPVGFVRQEIA